jgi:hypothetical protein
MYSPILANNNVILLRYFLLTFQDNQKLYFLALYL